MKKRAFCKILAPVVLLLLLALLGGCGKERQIVKKVHLNEPYLITFSGLSYENDPETCTYVRYGIDGQGNILLETASYDTEGVRLEAGHLYIKQAEGGYTHYTDEGSGYVLLSEERIGSAAINAAHFQDLYLFQLRLNDATTLHENAAFEEKGQSVFLLGGSHQFLSAAVKAQHTQIGGKVGHILLVQTQKGGKGKAADASQRIALGFGQLIELFQRTGLTGGGVQAVFQPFGKVGQGGKILRRHTAQLGQNGGFGSLQVGRGKVVGHGTAQNLPTALGQQDFGFFVLGFHQQAADVAGRGNAHFGTGRVVGGAHTLQGKGLHFALPVLQRQQIFHTKVVVGVIKKVGNLGGKKLSHSCLTGGGKGAAIGHQLLGQGQNRFTLRGLCGLLQQGKIAAFAAKGNGVAANGLQQSHTAGGKPLGRGAGPAKGQFHHKVGTAQQSHLGTQVLAANCGRTTLQKVAAHGHGNVGIAQLPQLLQLQGVSLVEGVVFGNYSGNFHSLASFLMF